MKCIVHFKERSGQLQNLILSKNTMKFVDSKNKIMFIKAK